MMPAKTLRLGAKRSPAEGRKRVNSKLNRSNRCSLPSRTVQSKFIHSLQALQYFFYFNDKILPNVKQIGRSRGIDVLSHVL